MNHDYPFTSLPTLETARLRLEPLDARFVEQTLAALAEPELLRMTGTHATFTREQVERRLAELPGADGRADWAIVRRDDDAYLGEVVLHELDADNARMGFRIALAGPHAFGQGYGPEATRAVVAHGFERIGLHRIELEVFAFNRRARRSYEKVGFVEEGRQRDALLWEGEWADAILMSMLSTDPRP
jgi:RimJ/RimL family protein N-acetyltransferase